MIKVLRGEADIQFLPRMRLFATVSAVLVTACVVAVASLGLNFGIDFAGGYEIQVKFPTAVTETQIKDVIKPFVADARVQRFGEEIDNEFLIMVREHGTINEADKSKLQQDFVALAGGEDKLTEWNIAESGELVTAGFAQAAADEAAVRAAVEKYGLTIKGVERSDREDKPLFKVSLYSLADRIEEQLTIDLKLPAEYDIKQRVEFVGPQVGAQLRNQGIWAVMAALFFILLYIGVRFDLFFAPGAVLALVHDVIVTLGVFAVFQLEFNLPIVAAILAIVGYSLNDTIVVYDRVRENVVRLRGRDLRGLVNASLNQTLSRTLLTSLTTMLVVLALLFFGGGIIRDFSIALVIGILVGTYSSVAIATPTYVLLREKYGEQTVSKASARPSKSGAA